MFGIVAAGCGSDDDDESTADEVTATTEASVTTSRATAPTTPETSTAPPTTAAGPSTESTLAPQTTEGGSEELSEPTGDPIKLSVMATSSGLTGVPHLFDSAQAAVAAINAAGGIPDSAGGESHPVELIECRVEGADSTSVPQVALDCANKAIDDGALADVGKYLFAQLAVPAFEAASVPLIGTFLVDQTDLTNPIVFGLSGGAVMELHGTAVVLEQAGATTLGFVSADNPAGRSLPQFIAPALTTAQITIEEYLPLDPSADVSTAVSKLVQENPDGIILGQTASVSVRLTQALRAAGYEGIIGFAGANLNDDTIEQLGDDVDNLVAASNYPAVTDTSNSGIQQYNGRDGRVRTRCSGDRVADRSRPRRRARVRPRGHAQQTGDPGAVETGSFKCDVADRQDSASEQPFREPSCSVTSNALKSSEGVWSRFQ